MSSSCENKRRRVNVEIITLPVQQKKIPKSSVWQVGLTPAAAHARKRIPGSSVNKTSFISSAKATQEAALMCKTDRS